MVLRGERSRLSGSLTNKYAKAGTRVKENSAANLKIRTSLINVKLEPEEISTKSVGLPDIKATMTT